MDRSTLRHHTRPGAATSASAAASTGGAKIVERAKAAGKLPPDFEPQDVGVIQTMLAAVIR